MSFITSLKGHTVESIFKTLLEDAGYIVVPLGIEKTIRELQKIAYERALFADDINTYAVWRPFILLVAVKVPPEEWKGKISHIRAFEIKDNINENFFTDIIAPKRIQDIFEKLKDRAEEETLIKTQNAIKAFAEAFER
jgi:hypothetical protein